MGGTFVYGQTPNTSTGYIDASGILPALNETVRDNGNGTITIGFDTTTGMDIKGTITAGYIEASGNIISDGDIAASGGIKSISDFEGLTSASGVILKSPDGSRYRVKVANGGAVSASAL